MSNVQFVIAQENDAATIVGLQQKVWSSTYRGIYPDRMIDDFDCEWHTEKELQRIRHPNYSVYLIVQNNIPIGYLTIRKTASITLQSLYVVSECQHQGIGKTAFNLVRKYCIDNGSESFICHCVPENRNARMFYERMGGKMIGEDMDNEETWMNSVIYQFDVT